MGSNLRTGLPASALPLTATLALPWRVLHSSDCSHLTPVEPLQQPGRTLTCPKSPWLPVLKSQAASSRCREDVRGRRLWLGKERLKSFVLCGGYSSSVLQWGLSPHLPLTFSPLAVNIYETQFSVPLWCYSTWKTVTMALLEQMDKVRALDLILPRNRVHVTYMSHHRMCTFPTYKF